MSLLAQLESSPRLLNATLVIAHEIDDRVRHRSEDAEKAFQKAIGGTVRSTNVDPSAAPDVPRLTLRQASKVLTLANSRIQLALSFPERRLRIDEAFRIVDRNAREIFEGLPHYRSLEQVQDVGLIVEIGYATILDPTIIFNELATALYSGPRLGSVVSMDLRVGFDTGDGYFANVGLGIYEVRQGTITAPRPPKHIDINKLEIEDRGLMVIVDVNSKPSFMAGSYDPAAALHGVLGKSKDLVLKGHRQFLGESNE